MFVNPQLSHSHSTSAAASAAAAAAAAAAASAPAAEEHIASMMVAFKLRSMNVQPPRQAPRTFSIPVLR
jgi:hypothetical protein